MRSYLSDRGSNSEGFVGDKTDSAFSSYLGDLNKKNSSIVSPVVDETVGNLSTDEIHVDETGIKVEVVSEDDQPRKILVHIPDGRIIELGCEY